jgi:hypothetical protein
MLLVAAPVSSGLVVSKLTIWNPDDEESTMDGTASE